MKKKLIYLLTAIFCLSACSNQAENTSSNSGISNAIYDKSVKVKVLGYTENYLGNETAKDNTWTRLYQSYNIKTEIIKKDEMNIYNFPDILAFDTTNMEAIVNADVLMDISDLLDKYASDELMQYLTSNGNNALEGATYDGKLYGLPCIQDTYNKPYVLCIRRDWLDNLGLKVPETMADLADIAYQFTYNDPDKNGKNDTYGIGISTTNPFYKYMSLSGVFQAFGAIPAYNSSDYTFIEKDGKIIWGGLETEKMKQALAWLKDLQLKGCTSNIYLSLSPDRVLENVLYGKCGIFWTKADENMLPAYYTYKQEPDVEFIVLPNLDGTGTGENINYIPNTTSQYFAVSKKCKNPEVLIYFMNMAVEKMVNPSSVEEYEMYVGDGENYTGYACSATPILPSERQYKTYKAVKKAFETGNQEVLKDGSIAYGDVSDLYQTINDINNGLISQTGETYASLAVSKMICAPNNSYYSAIESIIENQKFTYNAYNGYHTETMKNNVESLNKLFVDAIISIIRDEKPVDYYDEFVEEWKTQGGQEVLDEVNRLKN